MFPVKHEPMHGRLVGIAQLKVNQIGDQLTMLLWVDEDKRLCRMFLRGPNVEVIRSDLFDRLVAKQKDIKQNKP